MFNRNRDRSIGALGPPFYFTSKGLFSGTNSKLLFV